jgi:hypothetical protein
MDPETPEDSRPGSGPRIGLAVLLAATLGLAPFTPEPHVLGKLRWVAGGATGMGLMDWGDLAMHGAPWLWLAWVLISEARSAWRGT